MTLRILAFILLLASILFMPFWVSVMLALGGMIYFAIYWEAVALLLLSDVLYGFREAKYFNEIFISFIAALVVLIVIEIIKKKLKFYPNP